MAFVCNILRMGIFSPNHLAFSKKHVFKFLSVLYLQGNIFRGEPDPRQSHESGETECTGRYLQVVRQNRHNR